MKQSKSILRLGLVGSIFGLALGLLLSNLAIQPPATAATPRLIPITSRTPTACQKTLQSEAQKAAKVCASSLGPNCQSAVLRAVNSCKNGYQSAGCQSAVKNSVSACTANIPAACTDAVKAASSTCKAQPKGSACKAALQTASTGCKGAIPTACTDAIQSAANVSKTICADTYPTCSAALEAAKSSCKNSTTSTACKNAIKGIKSACVPPK